MVQIRRSAYEWVIVFADANHNASESNSSSDEGDEILADPLPTAPPVTPAEEWRGSRGRAVNEDPLRNDGSPPIRTANRNFLDTEEEPSQYLHRTPRMRVPLETEDDLRTPAPHPVNGQPNSTTSPTPPRVVASRQLPPPPSVAIPPTPTPPTPTVETDDGTRSQPGQAGQRRQRRRKSAPPPSKLTLPEMYAEKMAEKLLFHTKFMESKQDWIDSDIAHKNAA